MKSLCAYWASEYDWRKWEAELNWFPQFIAHADDLDIHFYREDGSGPSSRPLILSHGWPGSVFEFVHIIQKLAHPESFGGDVKDAFTVIVPSLPGYGWSGKPQRPVSPRTVARCFDKLMTDVLDLPDYIAQGGDWGSAISGWMGYEGKGCRAVHLMPRRCRCRSGRRWPDGCAACPGSGGGWARCSRPGCAAWH